MFGFNGAELNSLGGIARTAPEEHAVDVFVPLFGFFKNRRRSKQNAPVCPRKQLIERFFVVMVGVRMRYNDHRRFNAEKTLVHGLPARVFGFDFRDRIRQIRIDDNF